ncbi:MAG: GNAT family N-acetyltransferase [Actinomycetota bacterium]|nr:GNAT family N-acetyltransferase [Actinomycetota bacterium]
MEGACPARPDQLVTCARLLEEARDHAATLRGGPELLAASQLPAAPDPITEQWLTRQWTGPERVLLAGTIDQTVVGVGAGHVTRRSAERVGVVDCCYVEAPARGVGVGTALAQALVGWFTAAACAAVDAPALPGDRETKQLFESQGLSARLLILRRRLP